MNIFFGITLFYISRLRSYSSLFSFNSRDTIRLFLKFSKTDQKGEGSTIVTSILELSSDPLRPWTVNFTISFQKLYMCSISKVLLRPLNLCNRTATVRIPRLIRLLFSFHQPRAFPMVCHSSFHKRYGVLVVNVVNKIHHTIHLHVSVQGIIVLHVIVTLWISIMLTPTKYLRVKHHSYST